MNRPVLLRRLADGVELLHIARDDDAGHRALDRRDPHRAVDEVRNCSGTEATLHVSCATSLKSESRSTSCW
jgi:hypothetical protein